MSIRVGESQLFEDVCVDQDVLVFGDVYVVVSAQVLVQDGVILEHLLAAHGALVVVLLQDVPPSVVGFLKGMGIGIE